MPPPATINNSSSSSSGSSVRLPFSLPNPTKLRSYVFRLPIFTRFVLLVIFFFWILELQTVWSVTKWGALIPNEVGILSGGMYRLNTFPVIHVGFFHMLLDVLCLVPLLERFEMEWGTLNSLALFAGPLSTIPAAAYILVERLILRANTPVLGSSVWVFLLLGIEAIKTFRANPYLEVASYRIPTWTSPLALILATSILLPHSSFLGHICAVAVGYLFGLGYLKFLAPPDRILRWIEGRLNLLVRLPHYVSVDQKTYGRYGVLPQTSGGGNGNGGRSGDHSVPIGMSWLSRVGGGGSGGGGQRLGP